MTAAVVAVVWLVCAAWSYLTLVGDIVRREPGEPATTVERVACLTLATLAPLVSVWIIRTGEPS